MLCIRSTQKRKMLSLVTAATVTFSAMMPAAAGPPILEHLLGPLKRHGHQPATCEDDCIEELAANIDWLEHNIDRYGSIVAKSPDVWGEARLTKYRREVEEQLAAEVGNFEATVAGASSVRDLALLAAAVSFGDASISSAAGTADGESTSTVNLGAIPGLTSSDNFGMIGESGIFAAERLELEPTTVLDQHRRYLEHLNELRRINEGDDASDAPGYALNLIRIPVSVLPGSKTTHGYGAEITMTASMQLPDHLLAETYRDLVVNDLVDQLSLPLTRFLNSDPVKVAQLLAGFAAERNKKETIGAFNSLAQLHPIVTDNPEVIKAITDRLVKQGHYGKLSGHFSFRPLDLSQQSLLELREQGEVAQIRLIPQLPVDSEADAEAPFASLQEAMKTFSTHVLPLLRALDTLGKATNHISGSAWAKQCPSAGQLSEDQCNEVAEALAVIASYQLRFDQESDFGLIFEPAGKVQTPVVSDDTASNDDDTAKEVNEELLKSLNPLNRSTRELLHASASPMVQINRTSSFTSGSTARAISARHLSSRENELLNGLMNLSGSLNVELADAAAITTIPTSLGRKSTLPFPPSELIEIYGKIPMGYLALEAHEAFRVDAVNRRVVHLTDIKGFLREEISAAYEMLCQPEWQYLWDEEVANPRIVSLVRSHRHEELKELRFQWLQSMANTSRGEPVVGLSWAVFVESVLLNERFNEEIAKFTGGSHCGPGQQIAFYGCHSDPNALDAFRSYVAARWPLRVFTIDPVNTDQNIAETASIARQMQFAAAFAVASGEMRPSAALNFSRNLQRDFATVGLNQTAVGFVHGNDTFGWRFQPRFQTPPVQNNAVVLVRDLIGGGPTDNALRRQKRIEPGMRECIALVLAPSFVDGINIDTRSNWYRLNKPGHSALSMREITKQSRAITAMRRAATCCVERPDLYRDGELDRMLRRVDQLDRELPLQTLQCQVPNSNTLGGFEILSSGIRELAPELLGWYGSPGYQRGVDNQTFFLSGDNFSVHETDVIAGTSRITSNQLLSRQILRVTLPGNVPVIEDGRLDSSLYPTNTNDYDGYIDVHVATPYGVSGHLLIPVLKSSPPASPPTPSVTAVPANTTAAVEVTMKVKDGQYITSGDIQLTHLPIATIDIPETVATARAGLLGGNVDVIITPVAGDHPLESVVLAGMPAAGGRVSLGAPQLFQSLQDKGTLHASLGSYANWIVNSSPAFQSPGQISGVTPVDLRLQIQVRSDVSGAVISVGEIPLRMQFDLI